MTAPESIISDEEITRVHAYANFGSMSPREVVNDGVRKYAVGYTVGGTQVAILREHGLITATKGAGYKANLTEKGKRYARSIYMDVNALIPAMLAEARAEGRREGLRDAETLARGRYKYWHKSYGVECDFSACRDIAEGIKAILDAEPPMRCAECDCDNPPHGCNWIKTGPDTPAQPKPDAEGTSDLDARMKDAGMIPLSEMLNSHGPMEKWMRHANVKTFDDFVQWVSLKQREYMTMWMRYELGDKDKNDDLFEWVFAHAAVFDGVATQLRALAEGDSHE